MSDSKLKNSWHLKIMTICIIFLSLLVWPEEALNNNYFLLIGIFVVFLIIFFDDVFIKIFLVTFSSNFLCAILVYKLTAQYGVFETSDQNPLNGVTDSQFFLHEARRLLLSGDISALFSTWGSLVPVAYGAIALKLFSNNFVGIIFFNSMMYASSIKMGASILELKSPISQMFLPVMGLLPLQFLYGSMLSKEPIYLFLTLLSIFAFNQILNSRSNRIWNLIMLLFALLLGFFLRPGGVLITALLFLYWMILEKKLKFIFMSIVFGSAFLYLALKSGFQIPIFLITTESGGGFSNQASNQQMFMNAKDIPEILQGLFLPPVSILISPILSIFWLILPLPLLGGLWTVIDHLREGDFRFGDLATLIKYLDAGLILIALNFLPKFKTICISAKNNILFQFLILQILAIAAFNFYEASRHRYLPGFMLIMFIMSCHYKYKLQKSL